MKTFFLKNKVKIFLIFILLACLFASSDFTVGILSKDQCLEQECVVQILIPPPLSRVPKNRIFVVEVGQEIYLEDFREAHKEDYPYEYVFGILHRFPKGETLYANVTEGSTLFMNWRTFLLLQLFSLFFVTKLILSIKWGELLQELKRIIQLQKERRKKKSTS